ncbi:hypothetical protein BP5796_04344 [Coleophoma crateriformis]|uniref:N-acetyltransferase domain-containing protein n=1 Tax=Coleophoma crateriformis TaxID=565419 RepID=A0A3D8SI60_9HELO|nr:hypothetical protein BP5796_04344 [Coleophoma crateriformis]
MSDPEAFVLGRAERSDCRAMAMATHSAFLKDALWNEIFRDVAVEDFVAFWAEILDSRFETPDIMPLYKITEVATAKIVAWTGLRVPSTHMIQTKPTLPNTDLPKGSNMDLWQRMMQGPAVATLRFGYDPTKDFHRRGSHTHGDYQRQGHMRRLTQHCNAIVDAAGAKTYITCREAAVPLMLSEGYKLLSITNLDAEEWDRLLGRDANLYILMREPKTMSIHNSKDLEA